jgi:multiple sugar transport system permease protein
MKRGNDKMYNVNGKKQGLLFVLLSLVGLMIFYILPFGMSIVSVYDGNLQQYAGTYLDLFQSKSFMLAMKNMALFFCISIPILFFLSLSAALAIDLLIKNKIKTASFLFAVNLIPLIVPSIISATVVRIFFEKYGVINGLFVRFGLTPVQWLSSSMAFWILLMLYLWKNYGYCMVVLCGGLQSIDESTLEVARLEGASKLTILFKIMLPQMRSYIYFAITMGMIGIFKVFRESHMLFNDYPHESIYMIQNFINNSFLSLNYNKVVAASVLLIIVFGVFVKLVFFSKGEEI